VARLFGRSDQAAKRPSSGIWRGGYLREQIPALRKVQLGGRSLRMTQIPARVEKTRIRADATSRRPGGR
jgi:hypothetical protein